MYAQAGQLFIVLSISSDSITPSSRVGLDMCFVVV